MKWTNLTSNVFFAPIRLVSGFFEAFFMSLKHGFFALRGSGKPLRQSHFLQSLHFFFHDWPKKFWHFPTAIEIGRLPGTLLQFLFRKEKIFKENKKGFTLIEMMVSLTVFAIIISAAFAALGNITIFKNLIADKTDINQELYYAVESVVQIMKNGGDIDYEEYYNRSQIGTGTASGHYALVSNFGNSGSAISGAQKYGDYKLAFFTGSPVKDEDTGSGPIALSGAVPELYLIHSTPIGPERVYLRMRISDDPDRPSIIVPCDGTLSSSGCVGRLEMLKLIGKDTDYDGKIDTWFCNPDFSCSGATGTGPFASLTKPSLSVDDGWTSVLPKHIDVRSITFFPFPSKDYRLAWKEVDSTTSQVNVASYVRMIVRVGFAWDRRKQLKGSNPEINTTTTVSLDPY